MISIITIGRADGHTGDFTGRLIYAAQFNSRALIAAGVPHKFVFVEWNSPPALNGSVAQRYVNEVPNSIAYIAGPEWHKHMCDNPNMVIMEFFAKNVALRRCDTPVAVCINADILFGTDTLKLMAGWKGCESRVLYRTEYRQDIDSKRTYSTPEELMNPAIVIKSWKAVPPAYTQGAGDFQMAATTFWHYLGGFDETIRWAKIHKDHRLCVQALKRGGRVVGVGSCYHLYHDSSYVNQKAFPRTAPWGPEYNPDKWVPYTNPDTWGLSMAHTYPLGKLNILLPVGKLRTEIPALAPVLSPITVSNRGIR